MDLLLPWMRPRLERWDGRAFSRGVERGPSPTDRRDLYERTLATEPPGAPASDGPFRRVAAAILRYEIFPRRLVVPLVRRPIEVGDTVGARHKIPLGLSMFFASRVIERFDETSAARSRIGFVYRTLDGHPTLGEETFFVEKSSESGDVRVVFSAWSRPGLFMVRLFSSMAVRRQIAVNRGGLDRLGAIARGEERLFEV